MVKRKLKFESPKEVLEALAIIIIIKNTTNLGQMQMKDKLPLD